MELRRCDRLHHYVKTIKGGFVTNVLNVFRGQPEVKFKNISDIREHESFLSDNDDVEAVRSSIDVMEERIVKTESDVLVSDADDGDVQRIHNLHDDEDDSFILTLMNIKERCKARKRKLSQCLDSSKIKIEDPSIPKDYMKKQKMEEDEPDILETLTRLRTKLSKNMKAEKKKRCVKDHPMSSQEIVPVDQSEEILDSHELSSPFSGGSASLVEVKFDCPDNDCFDALNECSGRESKEDRPISSQQIVLVDESEEILDGQEFSPSSGDSAALVEVNFECPESDFFYRPCDFSGRESKEDAEMSLEWKNFFYCIPLRAVSPSGMDIVISKSELSSIQPTNFLAIDFEDNNQFEVSLPELASPKDLDITELECRNANTLLEDCSTSKDEYAACTEVPDKPCSTIEHGLNPDRSLVCCSDDSPEYEEKQSFNSVCDDDIGTQVSPPKVASHEDLDCAGIEFRADNNLLDDHSKDEFTDGVEIQHKLCSTTKQGLNPDGIQVRHSDDSPEYQMEVKFVNKAADELTSCDEHEGIPKLDGPERLLSTRKAMSPSQEKICKATESVNISHKNSLKHKGALQLTEQTDKNGDAEGLNDITTRTQVTNSPKKSRVKRLNPSKSSSNRKRPSMFRDSTRSRKATYKVCSTLQSCSKSAIAFSKQQIQDAEILAMIFRKELKSMNDIVNDMLQSELCLNTSLTNKVNEARMAVERSTKGAEAAKRWLSYMSTDCERFCKIMMLADSSSSSTPQDAVSPPKEVARKEKKIAFADEAGGRLCQVRFYKEDEGHLSESK